MADRETSLRNKTILITRPREQAAEMITDIERRGGRPVLFPTIRILDPASWEECDAAINRIAAYTGVVFTSVNGVSKFLGRCEQKGASLAAQGQMALYAVGSKTRQELERSGLSVTFVPDQYDAESLAAYFSSQSLRGQRFLCPRGNLGKDDIIEALREQGALVDPVTVYITAGIEVEKSDPVLEAIRTGRIDVVTFASPSAAAQFARLVPPATLARLQTPTRVAVIGPTTETAVLDAGFPVDIVAEESTARGLIDAIEKYFQ